MDAELADFVDWSNLKIKIEAHGTVTPPPPGMATQDAVGEAHGTVQNPEGS